MLITQASPVGVHHCSFEMQDLDCVMGAHDHLVARGHKLDCGVGRHLIGSQIFDYWRDPFGFRVEHYTDGDVADHDHQPQTYAVLTLIGLFVLLMIGIPVAVSLATVGFVFGWLYAYAPEPAKLINGPYDDATVAGLTPALQKLKVLDTGPEAAFDELTQVASLVCGTPIALVSLIALATKSSSGVWLDRVFRLHAVHGWLMSDEIIEQLRGALDRITRIPGTGLEDYERTLREMSRDGVDVPRGLMSTIAEFSDAYAGP